MMRGSLSWMRVLVPALVCELIRLGLCDVKFSYNNDRCV